MATPQLSPGIRIREVDLTVGRAGNVLDNIGAFAGPFEKGPVSESTRIDDEQGLIEVFGKPKSTDAQYEYWMSAANFLSYGGVLEVVRVSGSTLVNANAGVGIASTSTLEIDNYDDYQENHITATDFTFAAKNPGSWADGLKVCFIDDFADQTIGIATTSVLNTGAEVGFGVTATLSGVVIPGSGSTSSFTGYLKGIITGVTTSTAGNSSLDIKIVSRVETVGSGSTETKITYQEGTDYSAFDTSDSLHFVNNSGVNTTGTHSTVYTPSTVDDWYNQQTLGLKNSTVFWKTLAPKPKTNIYVTDRQGKNDGIHIAIVDDQGKVTGIQGNILEKHLDLSKALDTVSQVNSPQKIYYKQYLSDFSPNIYAGYSPSTATDSFHGTIPRATGFSADYAQITNAEGTWGQSAQGVTFNAIGNVSYTLMGGKDYSATGGMAATLGNLNTAYDLFENKDETTVDFIIMGPGLGTLSESQAKANYLIGIANQRKDCIACIGPHRSDIVGQTNTTTQTNNLINYFSPLTSSSFAVFDSGYKYSYDKFNNEFRYVPCNADVAGLMTRTSLNAYPWFSPAGQRRGTLRSSVKLAYNPNKEQRDRLYPQRINSFITKSGAGTFLFGDKTALSYASAFDRINVRRLFLTVERALESAAQSQLFELNDEITRANFRNIVEPYLRDIQAKSGVYGFVVICDETNNTPDIIDNNEFRADIFLKPTKSINYITLTFVATRTGISFEEVTGRV